MINVCTSHVVLDAWNAAVQWIPKDVLDQGAELLLPVTEVVQPYWNSANVQLNDAAIKLEHCLELYSRWEIALYFSLATAILIFVVGQVAAFADFVLSGRALRSFFGFIRSLPGVSHKLRSVREEVKKKVRDAMPPVDDRLVTLPVKGVPSHLLLEKLKRKAKKDMLIPEGHSMLSGTVYIHSKAHKDLLDQTYAIFSSSNPLHSNVFPSVVHMETEVVSMTAGLLGGGPSGNPDVCGAMTSGGTESILTAMKASRDYIRKTKGITKPEMIIANSAHAAYFKAAEYFNIKLVVVSVDSNYIMTAAAVKRALTRNTAIVVASAPSYPHGVMDDVEGIAKITRRAKICLHVDACLGGFVLPFARKLGYTIPKFDFSVPGVTSISVDTHKFGLAHKGSSVVLYSSPLIRQHQYTSITNWTGGLYISPGFAGSRAGGLIATAWAALVHVGEEGYLEITDRMMKAAAKLQSGISNIPELEVVGKPVMGLVAFRSKSKKFSIYQVHELMCKKGWSLNSLQFPAAVHFCFTGMNVNVVEDLLKDLQQCVDALKAAPKSGLGGTAALYGLSSLSPDREMVGEFLVVYQDALLSA